VKTLDEIVPADQPVVGGKAFNCARLRQAGFPVPDALTIPVDVADPALDSLDRHPWFDTVPLDERFAVRSSGIGEDSAGHSFAGIHETRLNVPRDGVAAAARECRRSAASVQAVAYRSASTIGDEAQRIGVLVQRMVAAAASGVAFTINPVTNADEIVINAAVGLGEALVSGQVDPDEFIVRKRDASIVSSRRGAELSSTERVLSDRQIEELARLLIRIESSYGAPQDVEWCHDGRQFWIVQSRPVTTRATHSTSSTHLTHSTRSASADPEWSRANLAEVLPDQTSPQVLDEYEVMLNKAQRQFMGRLLAPDEQLGPMFKVFYGRMYINVSQMRRVASLGGAPAANMLRSLGHPEAIHADDEVPHWAPISEILKCIPDFFRIARNDLRIESLLRRHEVNTRAILARISSVDPRSLSDRDIWAAFEWWRERAPDAVQIVFLMSGMLFRETAIRNACRVVGFSYERLVYTQLAAGERSVSTRQATELVVLAEVARHDERAKQYLIENDGSFHDYRKGLEGTTFLERFDRFLDQYGHRGRYESDWAIPRLHENPAPALFAIQQHLQSPPTDLKAVVARQNSDAAAAWREFEARLTTWQRWTMLPRIRSMLVRLKKQYVWREQIRSDLTRIVRYLRPYHLTFADRFVERGWLERRQDYFLIHFDEIDAVIAGGDGRALRAIATKRTAALEAERGLRMPMLMRESKLPALLREESPDAVVSADTHTLAGLCVSPGAVEAEVVVMTDPAQFASMRRGAILVAPATDPSWTPLFTLASGIIVEVGGMLSHASTIAREYGLPALANVKDATRLLRTGDRVSLDASGGRVRVLRESSDRSKASTSSH